VVHGSGFRRLFAHAAPFTACAVASVAGCTHASPPVVASARAPAASSARSSTVRSNVTRDDYAGAAACAPCHADIAAEWDRSPMRRMTRSARGAEVRAPFDGTRWRFKDDEVVLEHRGGDRFVTIERPGGGTDASARVTYRVTRILGGRTREDYVGVDVRGGHEEVVLPVSFVFATGAFRHKGYSVMVHERGTLRAGPVWSRTCIFCHNTIPEMDRLLGAIAGRGAHAYQGEQVDGWLPPDRRAVVTVTDPGAFARAAGEEMARLGAVPATGSDAAQTARRAIDVVRAGFDGDDLIDEGIGCEACHGGAREHTRDPRVKPSFVPTAPWLDVELPPGSAQAINRVCARCHQVLFSRYPFTWEGGRRDAMAGGASINSGEARDFLLGGCSAAMTCTSCHDPHGADDPDRMRALATRAGNARCTRCHGALADRERLRDHAHHDPDGAGGACIACHMPRKNMGLDLRLTRYHRIGSPTDPERVLGDRPLECALCHAGESVRRLVDAMEAWWPTRYPRQRLEELYGTLDANVMRATLARGKAHEQAVAIGVLEEAGARDAAPLIARQLSNAYPLVRQWAAEALKALGVPPAAAAPSGPRVPWDGAEEEPED
jgi:predicted CXXCH cytochrome family protein